MSVSKPFFVLLSLASLSSAPAFGEIYGTVTDYRKETHGGFIRPDGEKESIIVHDDVLLTPIKTNDRVTFTEVITKSNGKETKRLINVKVVPTPAKK